MVYTKNSSQNDEEHEALLARSRRVANASLILAERSAEEEDKMLHFQKRDFPPPEEVDWSVLPEEFQYWEKTLGLSHVQDQMGCGSCWSFPAVSFAILLAALLMCYHLFLPHHLIILISSFYSTTGQFTLQSLRDVMTMTCYQKYSHLHL